MANSEDYLDGLLDSISEIKTDSIKAERSIQDRRERDASRRAGLLADDDFLMANGLDNYRPDRMERSEMRKSLSTSDFLRDFEDDLDFEDTNEFLESFERELFEDEGIDVPDKWKQQKREEEERKENDELNVLSLNRIIDNATDESKEELKEQLQESSMQEEAPVEEAEEEQGLFEDDLMAGLGNILEDEKSEEEPTPNEDQKETVEEVQQEDELVLPDDASAEEAGEALLDDLTSILNDADSADANVSSKAAAEDAPEFAPDELDELPLIENIEDSTSVDGGEEEAATGDEVDEALLDLSELLDAADAADGDGEAAPAEGGEGSPAPAAASESGGEDSSDDEEEEEEKKGFLAKILGIFKKKKKSDDEEEEEEASDDLEELDDALVASGLVEGDGKPSKEDKKAEKERRKKEKAEKKAQKKKEKEDKKANKPPKEKKKKEKKPKEPDTSPKIPIKVLILFIFLSASMVLLVMLGQKLLTYPIQVGAAKSEFDHKNYLEAYSKLSGLNIKEEDTFLAVRIEMMAALENKYMQYEYAMSADRLDHLRALDALIQGEGYYRKHAKEADEVYDLKDDFDAKGEVFRTQLQNLFGVSEERSKEIFSIKSRSDYTKELYKVLRDQGLMEW